MRLILRLLPWAGLLAALAWIAALRLAPHASAPLIAGQVAPAPTEAVVRLGPAELVSAAGTQELVTYILTIRAPGSAERPASFLGLFGGEKAEAVAVLEVRAGVDLSRASYDVERRVLTLPPAEALDLGLVTTNGVPVGGEIGHIYTSILHDAGRPPDSGLTNGAMAAAVRNAQETACAQHITQRAANEAPRVVGALLQRMGIVGVRVEASAGTCEWR